MRQLAISLLGPFEVMVDGEQVTQFRSDTSRALLAYLATHCGVALRRDALAALLWPEQTDAEARRNLRVTLSRLRDALGDREMARPFLDVTRQMIGLVEDERCTVDTRVVREALEATRECPHERLEACETCAPRLRVVADLYRGDLLAGFALDSVSFEEWMVVERENLHWQALEALHALTAYHEGQGTHEEALRWARRQVELEPWREVAHRQWMRALAMSGHRGAALAQYDACRKVLAEELGVEPEPETVALQEQIRIGALAPPVKALPDRSELEMRVEVAASTGPTSAHSETLCVAHPPVEPPPTRRAFSSDVPGSERRTITVVQAEMIGTEALLVNLGAEEWATIVGQLLRAVAGEVYRLRGEVGRYDESGLTAFFGVAETHEDDPERGVLAALGMARAFRAQADELAEQGSDLESLTEMGLGVGVHTGEAVVTVVEQDGRLGRRTAVGEAITSTRHLLTAMETGEIRVSDGTYRLVEPVFEWASAEAQGPGPVAAYYRPIAHKMASGKGRGLPGMRSILVGRDGELGALREAVGRLQSGVGGIATVVGEAGIGKSRLVAEARETCRPTRWIEGRCLSYGEGIAYLPWLEALRALMGIAADASSDDLSRALESYVHSLGTDNWRATYAYLGLLLSVPLDNDAEAMVGQMDAESLRQGTFFAVEALLEHGAAQQPLVIVLEDLHWADPTSLALLEHVMGLVDRAPVLLVCVLRPRREHPCWRIHETAVRSYPHRHLDLQIDPLSTDEGEVLLLNLLLSMPGPGGRIPVEELPPALKAQILERGEGNPFYVEEIVRVLIRRGTIVCDEESCHWQVHGSVEDIGVPDTLYGVLSARMDQLPAGDRHVLQLASVIGRVFSYGLLAEIAERSTLEGHLVTLQREQMIRERARVPEAEYIFHHQLTLEAAYGSLLVRVRRELHRRVAQALERLYPERVEQQMGLLAEHWEQAGDNGRAIDYYRRAGERAKAQYAGQEAAAYYGRALALVPRTDLETQYDLLRARLRAGHQEGPQEVSEETDIATLKRLAEDLADPFKKAEAMLLEVEHILAGGDVVAGVAAAREAIEVAQAVGAPEIEALAHFALGNAVDWAVFDDPAEADRLFGQAVTLSREHFEQGLTLAQSHGLRALEAQILRMFGIAMLQRGEYVLSQSMLERALELQRQLGSRVEEGRVLNALSYPLMYQGERLRAKRLSEQSLRICQEMGNRFDEAWAFEALSQITIGLGEYGDAQSYAERCMQAMGGQMRGRSGEDWALFTLGWVYSQLGDLAAAATHLARGLDTSTGHSDVGGWTSATMAFMLQRRGDYQGSLTYARRSVDLAQGVNRRFFLPLLGAALAGVGQLDKAVEAHEQALSLWQGLGLLKRSSEPLAGLAQIAMCKGDVAQAQAYVDQILGCLSDPGAFYDVWEPLGVYLTCVQVLQASGDPRAEEVLHQGYDGLQARAATIDDERLLRMYLENVPIHREIVTEYKGRLV